VKKQEQKLRVLALMDETLVPPAEPAKDEIATADWKTEWDVTSTLRDLGHDVHCLGVATDLGPIRQSIDELSPHLVFNLVEDFHDVPIYDQNVVAYLELLRVAYTGCNPRGLMLARDKAISKKLMSYHRVPVPEFTVFRMGHAVRRPKRLRFPLIVKSLVKEGSAGISQTSIVDTDERLAERVKFVHDRLKTDAIAERYVDGRELYVGVLGNVQLTVLPVWELRFTNLPEESHRIATAKAKWDRSYQEKIGLETGEAKDLPEGVLEETRRLARRIYRVLELSGYARIDFRYEESSGKLYVLEANPNPQLAYGEDFADSAERAGLEYDALIRRIVTLGLRRRRHDLV
jgi:D-alanine-D-alanine ligase